ncbi:hypothetical protein [Actinobaculum massiliense]|uniref:hypothetical protein n=1 Tax=Actinobaculum massiliense TaxID=202789 RepID=UPI0002F9234E|nr:hypothetical protein [Actinobaculum massiliense]MDK8319330.1 hypothetical protein [Actinobaculum massiliense]MDK8566378.1 hypothetical protein [Actinobaculum massiliense]
MAGKPPRAPIKSKPIHLKESFLNRGVFSILGQGPERREVFPGENLARLSPARLLAARHGGEFDAVHAVARGRLDNLLCPVLEA